MWKLSHCTPLSLTNYQSYPSEIIIRIIDDEESIKIKKKMHVFFPFLLNYWFNVFSFITIRRIFLFRIQWYIILNNCILFSITNMHFCNFSIDTRQALRKWGLVCCPFYNNVKYPKITLYSEKLRCIDNYSHKIMCFFYNKTSIHGWNTYS